MTLSDQIPGVRWLPFLLLLLVITGLMGFSIGNIPENISEGGIAPYDIRADRQYTIIDDDVTKRRIAEARAKSKMVFDYDLTLRSSVVQRVRDFFVAARALQLGVAEGEFRVSPESQAMLEDRLGIEISKAQWDILIKNSFSPQLEEAMTRAVFDALSRPVVADTSQLQPELEHGVLLRSMTMIEGKQTLSDEVWAGEKLQSIKSLDEVRSEIDLGSSIPGRKKLNKLVRALLRPNCAPNLLETEVRRRRMVEAVTPVSEIIRPGTILARRYEPYSAEQVRKLRIIQKQKRSGALPFENIGRLGYVLLVLLGLHLLGYHHLRGYRPDRRDLIFLGLGLTVMVLLMRAGGLMGDALAQGLPLQIPASAYSYTIPLAFGAMLVRFHLNVETAILFAIAVSAFAGVMFPQDYSFAIYTLIVNLTGVGVIANVDKRSAILRAGLQVGLVAMLAVMVFHFMRAGSLNESLTMSSMLWYMGMSFLGTTVAAFLVLAATPLVESVFDYTSDIKLLELANLNHPLLRELVIRAPGTYHHSHLVGILAEEAASAIGANALLARVGAYYHDIGKIRKPTYFVENQKGESPHKRLSPHMSALIIASHIKDGIELARMYNLPQSLIDLIPQHHGTKQIGYFYDLAKKSEDASISSVEAKDFQYPGPKPQTREAGILLLADGVEVAVRALKEKTPSRVQQTVDGIINKSFAEGQLDECELTLRNLHLIGKGFTRILLGIYHQRIEYPRGALRLRNKDVQVVAGEEKDDVAVGLRSDT